MKKPTIPNSPTPHNVNEAAHRIGCAPNTLRGYIREGLVDVPRTAGGHAIFFEPQIKQAQEVFKQRRSR